MFAYERGFVSVVTVVTEAAIVINCKSRKDSLYGRTEIPCPISAPTE